MMQAGFTEVQVWGAAAVFSVLFPGLSFLLNRRWCGGRLNKDLHQIALLAGLTFFAAILCEASINPLYEALFQEKLWEYRVLPLHDRNVSVLALLVWTSYGVHLHFMNQSLDRWFAPGSQRLFYKAGLIGMEAPLLWEVSGNGFFLLLLGEYYAYYLPGDVWHLTSLRVVPAYMVCVFLGLLCHDFLQRHVTIGSPLRAGLVSAALFGAGLVFLGMG